MVENSTGIIRLPITAGNEITALAATGAASSPTRIASTRDLLEITAGTDPINITYTEGPISTGGWTTTDVNVTIPGGAQPTSGAIQRIRWKVSNGELSAFMTIDWSASSGGSNGNGTYTIDLTQLGITPDFTDIDVGDEFSAVPLGSMIYHDPGVITGQGEVHARDLTSIAFVFDIENNNNRANWAYNWGPVSARAEYRAEFRCPVA
jgi:hypothetical protein